MGNKITKETKYLKYVECTDCKRKFWTPDVETHHGKITRDIDANGNKSAKIVCNGKLKLAGKEKVIITDYI